ncbi:MAG: carbohydrate kinase family protein [Chloroflexi bacterium]|nr:carbohydrate kinase family protein [Chloroflexota bacterium]
MKNVLVIGGVSFNTLIYVDEFPKPQPHTTFSHHFHETVGSTGAGKAFNLHRLGVKATLHGVIGDDDYGHRLLTQFGQEGIPFIFDLDAQGTKRHVNLMDKHGRRISIFLYNGADKPELNWELLETAVVQSDIVALNITAYGRLLIPLIKKHNKPIWCDIHDYDGRQPYHQEFISAADVIHMSSDQMLDYRSFMESLIHQGKQFVICTHGKEGASALTAAGQWVETPILPDFDLVDSNGAGDAFFAGVLYGYLQGVDVETAVRYGAIASGYCITSLELASPELNEARLLHTYETVYPV